MKIYGIRIFEKLRRKNRGNKRLLKAINELIETLEKESWNDPLELVKSRPDADCVHSEGFYFFNIKIHRTMILIEFEENRATMYGPDHIMIMNLSFALINKCCHRLLTAFACS